MRPEVRHMVVFSLMHAKGSPEAQKFIADSKQILGAIRYAAAFDQYLQVSEKTEYEYGFLFDFMSAADYTSYNNDPAHIKYVEERWKTEVTAFMEIDLSDLDEAT